MSTTRGFVRPDRLDAPNLPGGDHELQSPPETPRKTPTPIMQFVFPVVILVMLVGMVIVMISMGGGLAGRRLNPFMLMMPLFLLMSVVGMLSHGVGGGNQIGELTLERKDYMRYLGIQRRRVQKTGKLQHEARQWDNPQPEVLPSLENSPRMWERRGDSTNFAQVRVGLGTERLATKLKPPETAPVDDLEPVCTRQLKAFVDTHKTQSGIPLGIALRTYPFISLTDEDDGADSRALVRSMICQLAAFHGPDDLLVVVVTEDVDGPLWGWVKWAPHNQHPTATDSLGTARMIYPDVATAREALAPLVRQRQSHNKDTTTAMPQLLVVADCAAGMTSAASLIGRDGIDGVTLIDLQPGEGAEVEKVPFKLTISQGLLYAPDDRGKQTKFAAPDAVSVQYARDFARMLSRQRPASEMDIIDRQSVRKTAKAGLLGHLGHADAAMVDPIVTQRMAMETRDFMRPAIGVTPADELIYLDLKELGQGGTGPHGILIGATGSGKSEFLRTLVLSLALTHTSEQLNMLLIDYKGGAAFLGFDDLPHTSAILTNMEAEHHLVDRMDVAIRGEINRRQEIFRAAASRPDVFGTASNIHEYNEIRASGIPLDPMPALFIVVDEFSALLDQNPDFAKLFALVGQQGRSFGIYLLLASQELRAGRISQVEAHLSYKGALRTNNVQESRDVLGTGDASELPKQPGAMYMKTVSGDLIRLRAFFTGDPYVPPKRAVAATVTAEEASPDRPRPKLFTAAPVLSEAAQAKLAMQSMSQGVQPGPVAAEVDGVAASAAGHYGAGGVTGPAAEAVPAMVPAAAEAVPAMVPAAAEAVPAEAGADAAVPAAADAEGQSKSPAAGANVRTVAQVLVDRLKGHGPDAHEIWLPPLDYAHSIYGLLHDQALYWPVKPGPLRIPIGLIDTPYYQRRDALVIDLMANNVAVVGSAGTGRSTALQTLIMSAAQSHSSDELQFYCLDFSNAKLMALSGLAHVGSVATRNETAKVSRTVAEMTAIVRRREKLFVEHNINGMADFRRRKAQNDPALQSDVHGDVVLVIDGWTTITRDEPAGLDHLENPITLLTAQGKSVGVHVVIASTRYADFKPAIKEELGDKLELRLNDASTSEVARKKAESVPSTPGRGIVKSTRPRSGDAYNPEVLDLLVALPILTPDMPEMALSTQIDVDVQQSIDLVNSTNPAKAAPIRLLPTDQPRAEFMAAVPPLAPPPGPNRAQLRVPLGLGEAEFDAKIVDFNDTTQTHFIVIADGQSGKTTMLRHIVTSLIEKNTPDGVRFLIVDFHRRLLGVLPNDEYGTYATTDAELQQQVAVLTAALPARFPSNDIAPARLNRRDWWTGPDIFVIIDNAHELGGHMGRPDSLGPLIQLLARGRDVGLHAVAAYRAGGISKFIYGAGLLSELKNLNSPGIIMSGPKDEGALIGNVKASTQPPGRGTLVTRDITELIQVPNLPAPDDE